MEYEVVARDLSALFPLALEGLEAATQYIHQFFEREKKPIDYSLAPNMVRWRVKDYLQERVALLEDCEQEDIANNGLSVRYKQYHVRIWKAPLGDEPPGVPSTGRSAAKDRFLSQQRHFQLRFLEPERISTNIAILWTVNANYELDKLYLACPKKAKFQNKLDDWAWIWPIDPEAAFPVLESTEPHQDQGLDLPYEPLHNDEDEDEAKEDPA